MEPIRRRLQIGIDVGKRHDPSAVVVAVAELRQDGTHYIVPYCVRLQLGMPYPAQAARMATIIENAVGQGGTTEAAKILVDSGGVGDPFVDLLKDELIGHKLGRYELIGVRISAGDGLARHSREYYSLGKGYFAQRLQVLSETHRIHLARTPETEALTQELQDFIISVGESGHATYDARSGSHDDLVSALCLATLEELRRPLILPKVPKQVVSGGGNDGLVWVQYGPQRW